MWIAESLPGTERLLMQILAWLATYALHSTFLLGSLWVISRRVSFSPGFQDAMWKVALMASLLTATLLTANPETNPLGGRLALNPAAGPEPTEPAAAFSLHLASAEAPLVYDGPATRGYAETVSIWTQRALPWALSVWAIVALAGLVRLFGAQVRLRRRLQPRSELTVGPVREMLDRLQEEAALSGRIRLSVSPRLSGPIALGRSEICLPERALLDLSSHELEGALAHELGHLARRDPVWRMVVGSLDALFFFQPLNRLAGRRLAESAEFLADDWAVKRTGSRLNLARSLVEVAGWLSPTPESLPAAGMAGPGSPLVQRVERLLVGGTPREASRTVKAFTAAALILGVVLLSPVVSVGKAPGSPASQVLHLEPAAVSPEWGVGGPVPAAVQEAGMVVMSGAVREPALYVVAGVGLVIPEASGQIRVILPQKDLQRMVQRARTLEVRLPRTLYREFQRLRREVRVTVPQQETPVPEGDRGPVKWI